VGTHPCSRAFHSARSIPTATAARAQFKPSEILRWRIDLPKGGTGSGKNYSVTFVGERNACINAPFVPQRKELLMKSSSIEEEVFGCAMLSPWLVEAA
jgi:hypothetical protein